MLRDLAAWVDEVAGGAGACLGCIAVVGADRSLFALSSAFARMLLNCSTDSLRLLFEMSWLSVTFWAPQFGQTKSCSVKALVMHELQKEAPQHEISTASFIKSMQSGQRKPSGIEL